MKKTTLLLGAVACLLFASGLRADIAETMPFLTTLLPANETPPLIDAGSANVIVWSHVVHDSTGAVISRSVDFAVSHTLPGPTTITCLNIPNPPVGIAAGIVAPPGVTTTP